MVHISYFGKQFIFQDNRTFEVHIYHAGVDRRCMKCLILKQIDVSAPQLRDLVAIDSHFEQFHVKRCLGKETGITVEDLKEMQQSDIAILRVPGKI